MLQPDLGTALVFGAIVAATLFMAGASLRWLAVLAGAAVAMVPFVWTYILADYQKARLTSFLDPLGDVQGTGYQLFQSQIAVGLGGWFGVGLTNGPQNAQGLLPVQDTDFVFAILAEELGFVGAAVVILLFVGLLWRVLDRRLALEGRVRDRVRERRGRVDPVPARRQRRDGHRHHAGHRHPAPVHQPRRRVADQHRARPRDHPEHQHPPGPRRVVTARVGAVASQFEVAALTWTQHRPMLRDMLPTTASGRFWYMFLLMGGVVIVGVVVTLAGALNEPVPLGGFAL